MGADFRGGVVADHEYDMKRELGPADPTRDDLRPCECAVADSHGYACRQCRSWWLAQLAAAVAVQACGYLPFHSIPNQGDPT